ncbi:hypothetical protein CIB84_001407 [Bambusicola thoracicus]|uniref:Uncharacterized protein n=1 Tax=Bambusicola thoracicus TaxID=9083 RepID=A0A2P4TEP1_BAMTH|nr:hypothetical protein CIB84_001407 [Bambusicola thoracicus]
MAAQGGGVGLAVSVLQDQASRLGVPAAVLAAKNAVTKIEQICQSSVSPSQAPLLNSDQRICHAVLQRMLTWVLDAVGREKEEDVSTLQAMRFWLNVFDVSIYRSAVHPDSLQQFFRHTLTEVLTYNPLLKVSDAIHKQREWSFARTCSLLTALYRKLFVAFSAKESICQLQRVLETHEVNWQHVLSCVSTLVVCQAEAEPLFRDLLSHLLIKAFENYDMENMITAFLIARQAALEGPAVFMPYSEWFKASFGNASGHHGSSKKALVFLFEFLSELVPFEVAPCLKVHIMYPPFVPTKHRSVLLEYITLAKTRLADLKVAIEDMGLYEDLSSTHDSVQLPKAPDTRMAFIDSLKRADKIPPNLYSTYLQACRARKEKMLQDESKVEPSHSKEPAEQLKAELAALRVLIVDQAKHEDVPAQIAVISDRLSGVLGHNSDENEAATLNSRIQVHVFDPKLQPCHQSGPSLNDAHILGLAAFMIHLCESRSLIPEIEADFGISQPVSEKVLSISEFWSCLLVCRTEESLSFCTRFCTAAVSYLLCKFSSFSCDDLCALVPPTLVKKLSFREWLLLELEMHPEKDVLSASERQDFHYWAIYQWYLPAPSASGGCDGDLEKACGVIIDCILDFSQSLDLGSCGQLKSVSPDIHCKLQKNISSRGYALSYGITAHFFRGLLNASLDCEESAEGVNDVLTTCQTKCPIVLFSAAESVDFQTSLEWALEILQCLEERAVSWPLLFLSAEGSGKYSVLHSAASDCHSQLLPVAFYSLTPGFHHKLLTREHLFLYVALDLYIQLLQLFVEGKDLPQPEQLLEACEKLDPEVGAALLHFSQPAAAMEEDEELFLF